MTAQSFFDKHIQYAINAGKKFNLNPLAILAVASYETGYGESYSAKNDNNFFGLSASTYFNNAYWDGMSKRATTDSAGYYRVYTNPQNSFYDFAWLISTASRYRKAYDASFNITEFANQFAVSGYFTGNQANYKAAIISRAAQFETMYKGVSSSSTGILAGILLAGVAIVKRKDIARFLGL